MIELKFKIQHFYCCSDLQLINKVHSKLTIKHSDFPFFILNLIIYIEIQKKILKPIS